jgi:BirA family biotin operon repressor/biotin-[acetyl-CoA-carboxylase] ligase
VQGKTHEVSREILEPLSVGEVARRLSAGARAVLDLEVLATVDSTNSYLQRIAKDCVNPTAVASELQTAGRGRYGRTWLSEPGASLCVSLLWPFKTHRRDLGALSLAVGMAVAEVVRAEGIPAYVKWPNDIVLENAKLAGVLLEGVPTGLGAKVIVGIGLNLAPSQQLLQAVGRPVAGLGQFIGARALERNRLLSELLSRLVDVCNEFEQSGFAGFAGRWREFDALIGRAIRLEQQHTSVEGTVLGVDGDGGLLLDEGGLVRRHFSGEAWVKVRA